MLDNLSLDQLRTFLAAADAGSFSAAARKLHRAQSVVSQTLANLEVQSGVKLFDRAGRYPVLTEDGRALLADARAVVERADAFKARAKGLAGGVEAQLGEGKETAGCLQLEDASAAFYFGCWQRWEWF